MARHAGRRHGRDAGSPGPPCRPGRAVFPHPVPRLHSRPRKAEPLPVCPVCYGPQGGWLLLLRSDMSGLSVLSGLHASVETFPLSWAFPTAEYSARYDSLAASGGLSLLQYSSACLNTGAAGAAHVLRRLSSCLPRPEDSGGTAPPCQHGWSRVAVVCENPRRPPLAMSTRYQHVRGRGSPCGRQDTLSTPRPSCSPCQHGSPWTQDSLRVGGYPLPGRDFHPARDAKLFLARQSG